MANYETLSEILTRVEKKVDALEGNLVHRAEFRALERDVRAIQDSMRWLTRTAGSALVLALLDPVIMLLSR